MAVVVRMTVVCKLFSPSRGETFEGGVLVTDWHNSVCNKHPPNRNRGPQGIHWLGGCVTSLGSLTEPRINWLLEDPHDSALLRVFLALLQASPGMSSPRQGTGCQREIQPTARFLLSVPAAKATPMAKPL